jgi:hypothetical protein
MPGASRSRARIVERLSKHLRTVDLAFLTVARADAYIHHLIAFYAQIYPCDVVIAVQCDIERGAACRVEPSECFKGASIRNVQ